MFRFCCPFLASCLILSCVLTTNLLAQDSHQWHNQYGTKGSLLGGIVVGSSSDLSASFYNPGWVAHNNDPSFLMSTKAWEASSIKIIEGWATGTQPASSHVGTSPGFMAWQLSGVKAHDCKFVLSFLNRVRFDYNTSVTRTSENDSPDVAGNPWSVGEAYRHAKIDENWFGLTMARTLNEKISGGITLYGIYRSQQSRLELAASRMTLEGAYSSGRAVDEFKFWHTRMLAKIGFAYNGNPFSFGVTFTTPSVGIMGSGDVYQKIGYSQTNDITGGPTETFLAADVQNDLDASWQSAMALAIGTSWKRGVTRVHFTAEWFDAVSNQIIMEPDDYYSQTSGQEYEYISSYNYRSIINFGFGLDHYVKEKFALYCSFRSDFTLLSGDEKGNYLMTDWNIWHLGTGASFEVMGLELTTGLQYSFGNGITNRYLNLGSETGPASIDEYGSSDVDYRNLKLMFGFDFSFSTQ